LTFSQLKLKKNQEKKRELKRLEEKLHCKTNQRNWKVTGNAANDRQYRQFFKAPT